MTAHPEDRAHGSERRVANHSEGRWSKRRKDWGTEQTVLQKKACTSSVCDTPPAFKRVKMPSDLTWPSGTQRLHPAEFIPSSHIRDPLARQNDGLTDTVISRPQYLPSNTLVSPLPYENSGQARGLAKPDRHLRPSGKIGAVVQKKEIGGEDDKKTEESMSLSAENTQRQSSSPQQILNNRELLELSTAKHHSRRHQARQDLVKRYAPILRFTHTVMSTASQAGGYNALPSHDMQQLKASCSTVEGEHINHSHHCSGKPDTISASQESFDGDWLDGIDPALWPNGNSAVRNPGLAFP